MALTLAFGAQAAVAQGDNPLPWDDLTEPAAYVTFDIEETNWTLYPVITADSNFIGFFGYMPDEFVVGDNVSLLWLTPDNGDGTWSMYGWSHSDLKVVSQYLDQLTNTTNVLADTGLDIFVGEPQPISEPQSMPFGISEDDPVAPIVEATQDPVIAEALILVGAAGAPNLTAFMNLPPVPLGCDIAVQDGDNPQTQLDMVLAWRSRVVQEVMTVWLSDEILDSLQATGYGADEESLRACCTPINNTIWGPWSPWSCGSGPFTNVGGTLCKYLGCSRTRSGWNVIITATCVFTRTPVTCPVGPIAVSIPMPVSGICPPSP